MDIMRIMTLPLRAARYIWRVWREARPAAKRHGISVFRIIREQLILKHRNALPPHEYFWYGLEDPAMPWEEKPAYLGGPVHRRHWFLLTPERYHFFFKNKLIFKHIFRSMGFPVAELYAVYDPVWGHTGQGAPFRSAGDIAAWMAASDVEDPVFKPMESAEGRMVFVMAGRKPGDPTRFVDLAGEEYSPERIVEVLNDPRRLRVAYPAAEYGTPLRTVLVEQRLHQHPALKVFAPDTLCCARLVTLTTLDGRVELIETAMKLQWKPTGMDNVTQGAMSIPVDPQTGVLGPGRLKDDPGDARREVLPDTGERFAGFRLPMWPEAAALAKSAAAAFPNAHTVGWDIAFTEDGPVIVEGNAAWGDFQIELHEGLYKGAYKELVEQLESGRPEGYRSPKP